MSRVRFFRKTNTLSVKLFTSIARIKRADTLRPQMLDHLVSIVDSDSMGDFTSVAKAAPDVLLAAQVGTADWLDALGAPSDDAVISAVAASTAQQAFAAVAAVAPAAKQRGALVELKTPAAVRHLVGMLTEYDWEFVEKAKEMRAYAVSKIMEETTHPDARIRLRALELLGRVTEVALFTDRVEIKKTELADHELDAKIQEKLNKFMGVVDVDVIDVPPAGALQ